MTKSPALTETEREALRRWVATYGRTWKADLLQAWQKANYGAREDDSATLQSLRNDRGPRWLSRLTRKQIGLGDAVAWKPEVIADNSGKWCGNALVFATEQEAKQYVFDLSLRWTMVRDTRVRAVNETVTARISPIDGRLEHIKTD
jgi:hypothetical protein